MRNVKRLEYELEWGGLYLGLAAGNLRIDQKAKISEKFFVSPKRSKLKICKPAVLLQGGWDPVLVFHIFLLKDRKV